MKQEPMNASSPHRPWLGLALSAGMLVLIVVAQLLGPSTSYQLANIATAVCALIGTVSFCVWWARFFATTRVMRWLPSIIVIGAIVSFASLFRVTGVNGELIPIVRWKWASRAELPQETGMSLGATMDAPQIILTPQSHPGFLGANRNGVLEQRAFAKDWNTSPPKLIWKHPIGGGLAGVAVVPIGTASEQGQVSHWVGFTLEQREGEEWVTCYDLRDGSLVWSHQQVGRHENFFGDVGPRSTPTVDREGRVYALGATGTLWCLQGLTGELLWQVDLLATQQISQKQFEVYVKWGRSASPLRVDDLVVVPLGGDPATPGGSASLIAFDAASGEVVWTSGSHQISYASPVVASLRDVRQILSVDEDYVSATAIEDGKVLWTAPWPGNSSTDANCSNPLALDNQYVLLSKEYGGGALLLRVDHDAVTGWTSQVVWDDQRLLKTKFTNVVADGEVVYGLSNGMLECVRWLDGKRLWQQGRSSRYGHGHVVRVDDVLVSSTDVGEIALVDATPERFHELGRFQAIEGKTWNPPTVFENYVLLRNGFEMALWQLPSRSDREGNPAPAVPESPAVLQSGD